MKKLVNGVLVDMTQEEIEFRIAEEIEFKPKRDALETTSVVSQRNILLQETDWMALSDNTMTPEWASYRQALRDITGQTGFPYSVTWPTKP